MSLLVVPVTWRLVVVLGIVVMLWRQDARALEEERAHGAVLEGLLRTARTGAVRRAARRTKSA